MTCGTKISRPEVPKLWALFSKRELLKMAKSARSCLLSLFALAVAMSMALSSAYAGTAVLVGANVPEQQRIPADQIDHSAWDALLRKYVDNRGMVNYAGWKATKADMQALDNYLTRLSAASFSRQTSAGVKLAFWINAYNAVTIKGILREYPTTSIRNHTAKVFGYNIWKDLQLQVEGRQYSLDHIEHEILRKMGEPRIHFAIVCASIGCPRLLNEAYVPDRIDQQLTAGARVFFDDPSKFRYDQQRGSIAVSAILDWFGADFGRTRAEQVRRIAPYLPEPAAQRLAESGNAQVSYLDYDWGLNDQAKVGRASTR